MAVPFGLTGQEVAALQQKHGRNVFQKKHQFRFVSMLYRTVTEPMFLMLTVACAVYFVLGQTTEGSMMLAAISLVTAISWYGEGRSSRALKALQQLTAKKISVVRSGTVAWIDTEDLVPGDVMQIDEGTHIPADAQILNANDFTVNEAVLTGEAVPVTKGAGDLIFQGTTVGAGKCSALVVSIGNQTQLEKLGKSISTIHQPKTLLQKQLNKLVHWLTFFGVGGFLLIFLVNVWQTHLILPSILLALTLAMAAVPEELPVAFSSFMALGAYQMTKWGLITRQPQTIENLGAVSVICLDKTGTITENRMQVKNVFVAASDRSFLVGQEWDNDCLRVLRYAVLASEHTPFDAMEKAIVEAYQSTGSVLDGAPMIREYPLEGKPPMMTHVYSIKGQTVVAAKGAAERILKGCTSSQTDKERFLQWVKSEAAKGYRVLAVASAKHSTGDLPAKQDDFEWHLEGFVSLYDPPRKDVAATLTQFYAAGIDVKLLTGDYPETALTICSEVGLHHNNKYLTGEQVMALTEEGLLQQSVTISVFARMFPEAKMKLVKALQADGKIVAMTGDGVNDGPAIKAADIGIAMGKEGTDIARMAADLVLTTDKLQGIVKAIEQGRKIYTNLKKAVRYIIAIHIPIILTAALPLVLGWKFPSIFTPIHVIFLELIMGPTCSLFYEREPVSADLMLQPPRSRAAALFSREEVGIAIVQGLMITAGVLMLYYFFMNGGAGLEKTRTVVFTTLLFANLLLTFANRSHTENFFKTIRYKNKLAPFVFATSVLFLISIHTVPFLQALFRLVPLSPVDFFICIGTALLTVFWFEGYKTHLKEVMQ